MQTYVYAIEREVKRKLPNVDVEVTEVEKDNSTKLTGLSIREQDSIVGMTIYVDDMFNDGVPVEEAVESIVKVYAGKPNINTDNLQSFDTCKDSLKVRLYGHNMNHAKEESNVTFVGEHGDFVVPDGLIAEVYIEYGDVGIIAVSKSLPAMWDTPVQDVISVAIKNTKDALFPHISPLGEVVKEYVDEVPQEAVLLTNGRFDRFGAVAIGFVDALRTLDKNAYILPCSIHEVIVFSAERTAKNDRGLTEMVREVNETTLEPRDVLLDRPWYWDGEKLVLVEVA